MKRESPRQANGEGSGNPWGDDPQPSNISSEKQLTGIPGPILREHYFRGELWELVL